MTDILVIDDDKVFRTLLFKLLTRNGHNVVACEDGKTAVHFYRKNPQFLVITDLIMPGQEGIETIMLLCKEFPDVKIIAMSAGGRGASDIYLDSAASLGASRTFSKPFDFEEFLMAVKELSV